MIANAGKVDRSIVTNNHRKNHRLSLRLLLPVSKRYVYFTNLYPAWQKHAKTVLPTKVG
jgi:hypothetical protein